MSKAKQIKVRNVSAGESLNALLEAVALIIARRQMKLQWATATSRRSPV